MIEILDKMHCSGCHACYEVCPQQSITMQADSEGFTYPVVDIGTCTDCGLCERICPILHPQKEIHDSEGFACMNRCVGDRLMSSSGGVFSLLAEQVIAKGGVVFGALFDEHFRVVHAPIRSMEELGRLRGSKYVQSDISGVFPLVREALSHDTAVLFSGTPCQIAGLRAYLGREYDKLLCVDLVCHGVPSPRIWDAL